MEKELVYPFLGEFNLIILRVVLVASPILLSDPLLVSRPCTYVDFKVERKTECDVELLFEAFKDLVSQEETELLGGIYSRPKKHDFPEYKYAMMGRACQHPLGGSGDQVTIDWGYLYLASLKPDAKFYFDSDDGYILCCLPVKKDEKTVGLVIAYDDLISINYFGEWKKAYWTNTYATILDAVGAALKDRESVLEKAKKFDKEIQDKAEAVAGRDYAYLCNLSYRQAVAAHKLICSLRCMGI